MIKCRDLKRSVFIVRVVVVLVDLIDCVLSSVYCMYLSVTTVAANCCHPVKIDVISGNIIKALE